MRLIEQIDYLGISLVLFLNGNREMNITAFLQPVDCNVVTFRMVMSLFVVNA